MAKDERVNLLSFTGSCEVGEITVTMAQMIVIIWALTGQSLTFF